MLEMRVRVAENGRVVIPAEIRRELGIKAGEQVVLSVHGHELRMTTMHERISQVQKRMKAHFGEGVRMSDRLIEERREEARREQGGS